MIKTSLATCNKVADGGAVLSLHTPSQAWMGGNDKSSGANALSSTNENILTNSTYQSQATQGEKAMEMLREEYKEKDVNNFNTHRMYLCFRLS